MREYRGKRIDNGEWAYGDLIKNKDKYFIHPQTNVFKVENGLAKIMVCHEVIPETVGQFTGVYDKNGKKIFEDDIVKVVYIEKRDYQGVKYDDEFEMIETVIYHEKHACFMLEINNEGITLVRPLHDFESKIKIKEIEVIGNIHDKAETNEPEVIGNIFDTKFNN